MTTHDIGTYEHAQEVNGTSVYMGGVPARRRVPGTKIDIAVCCNTCTYCETYNLQDDCYQRCRKIVNDHGRYIEIRRHRTTRCLLYSPMRRYSKVGKSSGKVDPPELVRWKAENADIINRPKAYGKRDEESTREFLLRLYHQGVKARKEI